MLGIIQVQDEQAVCINGLLLFFKVATGSGMRGIRLSAYSPIGAELAGLGLQIHQDGFHAN